MLFKRKRTDHVTGRVEITLDGRDERFHAYFSGVEEAVDDGPKRVRDREDMLRFQGRELIFDVPTCRRPDFISLYKPVVFSTMRTPGRPSLPDRYRVPVYLADLPLEFRRVLFATMVPLNRDEGAPRKAMAWAASSCCPRLHFVGDGSPDDLLDRVIFDLQKLDVQNIPRDHFFIGKRLTGKAVVRRAPDWILERALKLNNDAKFGLVLKSVEVEI
jgi:hypothetical protein